MTANAPLFVDLEIDGPEGTRVLQRLSGPLTIGRADGNAVVLKHDDVSRKHAVIEVAASGLVVHDVSTNGTFVDGRRVRGSLELALGRQLQIGPYLLRFRRAGAPATAQAVVSGEASVRPRPAYRELNEPSVVIEPTALGAAPRSGAANDDPAAPPASDGDAAADERPGRPALHRFPERPTRQPTLVLPVAAVPVSATRPAADTGPAVPAASPLRETDASQLELPLPLDETEHRRIRRWLRAQLLDLLDLPPLPYLDPGPHSNLRERIETFVEDQARALPETIERRRLCEELCDELLSLGPLDTLMRDPHVRAIMVVDHATVYVERDGTLRPVDACFASEDALRAALDRLLVPLGLRSDEWTPMVDVQLADGTRLNAVIPPLARRGTSLTLRKRDQRTADLAALVAQGTLAADMARLLAACVRGRKNILVAGGAGAGKTTLLTALASAIDANERIITIEAVPELELRQPHRVALTARLAASDGSGGVSLGDLVRHALRMRPDRIVLGECRGGEALEILCALGAGCEGMLCAIDAHSAVEAVARLELHALQSGVAIGVRALRARIAAALHIVVQLVRLSDGTHRVSEIAEVCGLDEHGHLVLQPVARLRRNGDVTGAFALVPTDHQPTFVDELVASGLLAEQPAAGAIV